MTVIERGKSTARNIAKTEQNHFMLLLLFSCINVKNNVYENICHF